MYKYYYDNGNVKEHTKLIERKTIEREEYVTTLIL